jgi:hypothetical protein
MIKNITVEDSFPAIDFWKAKGRVPEYTRPFSLSRTQEIVISSLTNILQKGFNHETLKIEIPNDETVKVLNDLVKLKRGSFRAFKEKLGGENWNVEIWRRVYLLLRTVPLWEVKEYEEVQKSPVADSSSSSSSSSLKVSNNILSIYDEELAACKFYSSPLVNELKVLLGITNHESTSSTEPSPPNTPDGSVLRLLPLPFKYEEIVEYSKNARFILLFLFFTFGCVFIHYVFVIIVF